MTTEERAVANGILLVEDLDLSDYPAVVTAAGVVCESCESTSHIAVVCRIIGVPVVVIDRAMKLFRSGEAVVLDGLGGRVRGLRPGEQDAADPAALAPRRPLPIDGFRYQVSIIEDVTLIEAVNGSEHGDVDHFFLREELLWVARNRDPFTFLATHGPARLTDLLADALIPLVSALAQGQVLNFRALDIRSDQRRHFGEQARVEPNPNLGLHGIRQLLLVEEYVAAELRAVDRLRGMGFENIVYSIPFLSLTEELTAVLRIRDEVCAHAVEVGVFLETPASVTELPRLLELGVAAVYVGTKDLSQLILGADRDNQAVAHLLDPNRPPVVQAVARVVSLCVEAGVPCFVFMFGEHLELLQREIPQLNRVSLPASDYLLGRGRSSGDAPPSP